MRRTELTHFNPIGSAQYSPLVLSAYGALLGMALVTTAASQTRGPSAAEPVQAMGEVEIKSNRDNDTQVRRESTAAKIVIGREEIDKQGDASLGEVLKRLPGITIQGTPGRGGAIRMRGMGGGYTQILLDGQRVPPGFSVDSLTPEQVEKIEIMRAPTAETGARAIAGTINIVLREGQKANPDDFKLGTSLEHGQVSEQVNWVHNLKTEGMNGTFTLSSFDSRKSDDATTHTVAAADASGALPASSSDRVRDTVSLGHRQGIHANARLQWRGEQGTSLVLMPFVIYSDYNSHGRTDLRQIDTVGGVASSRTDSAILDTQSRFVMTRLNGQWNRRLSADDLMEVKFGLGRSTYKYNFNQAPTGGTGLLLNLAEGQDFTDLSTSLTGKLTQVLKNGHQLVSGLEYEGVTRDETANSSVTDDMGDLKASTKRWAIYTQDEWKFNEQWSAHAGLRYENIVTSGTSSDGLRRNTSSVLSPLLHALWKPVPGSRDQFRMSLTRSYKTPTLYNLVALPALSRETNSPTRPDRVGNPDLRPELATGIDLAAERYFEGGGLISANVFRRNITDLIRYTINQRSNPSWAPGQNRWVSSPQNVGDAVTQGIELEAKFRLNQWWTEAWPVDIRSNMSFFRSQVKDVPGPNNRLDQQPDMTANLGADYRFRSAPFTVGGNINYNPDYTTRQSDTQTTYQGAKKVVDVYGLWRYSTATAVRLTVSNLTPSDYITGSSYMGNGVSEIARTTNRNWQNVTLRLEMKI
jgi:iron complex outermembrane receptor protein